jgi:phosphoenolpyruvate-protein kinase (PTS system EI component)
LIGMGLRRLSVSPRSIPEIKAWIRDVSAAELAELAEACLAHSTAAEVLRHLEGFFECALAAR